MVELGAGTGAITRALLSRIDNPERLVCIERSPVLVDLLQKRFPTIRVIEGDARQLDSLLRALWAPTPGSAISFPACRCVPWRPPARIVPAGIPGAGHRRPVHPVHLSRG
ncbi:MAG: methyltransferase domain-containing protein [Gammaproteobacteria bacterium]|nr:methyltransferase domain-containing protein [Gammaproteobacteria bacterium]